MAFLEQRIEVLYNLAEKRFGLVFTQGLSKKLIDYFRMFYSDTATGGSTSSLMCAHLLDNGWKEPRFVDVCPIGALKFGEESDFKALLDNAEIMKPENDTKPRVYYIGLPKRFIAGAVYDPEKEECIENATVMVTR